MTKTIQVLTLIFLSLITFFRCSNADTADELKKAKLLFQTKAVELTDRKDFMRSTPLFHRNRFANLSPNITYFESPQNLLTVYFKSSNGNHFKKYIEISYKGTTNKIETGINAEGYSGVVIKNILYLSWILGPDKGHILPKDRGKIFLLAFDLENNEILYNNVVYSGSTRIVDTSLSYLPSQKTLILIFEKLNSEHSLFSGKIPISKIKLAANYDIKVKSINVSQFSFQHTLPLFFKTQDSLYYFSEVEEDSFLIIQIASNGEIANKYLLKSNFKWPDQISFDDIGNLYVRNKRSDGNNQTYIFKIPIKSLYKI